MKKAIVLSLSLLLSTTFCFSQDVPTLHAIIVAATHDTTIGEAAQKSCMKFTTFLHSVANEIGYEWDETTLKGYDCKRNNLMKVLDDFQCDTSDIVVFCYLGHGVRSIDDKSDFPQMCFHGESQSNYLPVEYVKNRLAKYGSRITWVIGDCCNSYSEYVSPKNPEIEPQTMTIAYGAATNLYPKLFKEFTGVITMCASKKGTYGWSRSDIGMLFNNALINTINHFSLNGIIPGQPWQSVMTNVQNYFTNHPIQTIKYPGQTFYMIPQYIIEPRNEPWNDKGKSKGKSRKKVNTDRIVEAALANLFDNKVEWLERTQLVDQIMRENFGPNAQYRKLTPSGTPYGGGEVRRYLEELSRSENVANIIVLNVKRDKGKVIYMDVIEVNYEN